MLSAAGSLFATRGYDDTSMSQIAQAVGLQRASLYHYFPSKAAIFLEIVTRYVTPLVDMVERWKQEGPGGPLEIYRYFRIDLRYILASPYELHMLAQTPEPLRRTSIDEKWGVISEGLRQWLSNGIESGELREIDIDLAAALLTRAYFGVTRSPSSPLAGLRNENHVIRDDPARTADLFAEWTLRGLLSDDRDFEEYRTLAREKDGLDPTPWTGMGGPGAPNPASRI